MLLPLNRFLSARYREVKTTKAIEKETRSDEVRLSTGCDSGSESTYASESLLMSPGLSMRFSDSSTCSLLVYMYFLASEGGPARVCSFHLGQKCKRGGKLMR